MKKLFVVVFAVMVSCLFLNSAYGAEVKKPAAPQTPPAMPARRPMPQNILFVAGSISKIDTSVPGSTKVEITNDFDNKAHVIELPPTTNILKSIDITELKVGDKARIMARKADDKEIALNVVTGNLKELPRPKAMPPAEAAKPGTKQEQIKK